MSNILYVGTQMRILEKMYDLFTYDYTKIASLAIKRTPHYDVRSAPPRALNIGTVRITALAPARAHKKI